LEIGIVGGINWLSIMVVEVVEDRFGNIFE